MVSFSTLHKNVVETLIRGNWSNLIELHLMNESFNEQAPGDSESWSAAKAEWFDMCESKWPGIRLFLF